MFVRFVLKRIASKNDGKGLTFQLMILSPRETSFAHSHPQGYERCTSGKARNAIPLILRKSPEESGVGVTEGP